MQIKKSHGRDLTVGSIPRHIIFFSLPMLIGSFLQTAYSFVNAIWVGQFLGTAALAAVTVSFPIIFAFFAMGMGLTLATNILVSQSYGAKKMDELRLVVDSSTLMIFSLGIFLVIFGEIFAPMILRAMNTPPDIYERSLGYLRVIIFSLPLGFGIFLIRSLFQGIGDSKTPLYFQLGSVLFTAALDPILMFGWLGFPKLGLNGTAWATITSQFIVLVLLVTYLHRNKIPVALSWPRFHHLGPITLKTLKIGVPAAIQQSLVSVGMVFVTGLVNGFGQNATASFGATSRIDQIAFMPALTFGMAISTLAGQNLGAKKFDRVKEIFYWGCLFSAGITFTISLIAVTLPHTILSIFVTDPVVIDLGVSYLHIVGACYLFFSLTFVSNGIINGAGHTLATTIISLISLWVVRVPVAAWLSQKMGSVIGIWYAIALSFMVSMVFSMTYYFSGRWKKCISKIPPDQNVESNPAEIFGHDTGEA